MTTGQWEYRRGMPKRRRGRGYIGCLGTCNSMRLPSNSNTLVNIERFGDLTHALPIVVGNENVCGRRCQPTSFHVMQRCDVPVGESIENGVGVSEFLDLACSKSNEDSSNDEMSNDAYRWKYIRTN
jgi:hypothetical protein